ncbi:uncharacterized protein E0L32_006380 [Thyridium curvatum]|uniref:U6 snRNA-associated Sm-like protein LSm1 n=1 Tax=Thyridium curvatum TaxID=1093900 RepID=A0A507B9B2_9PEZI|nr:uncharacterized protein E0L32_006380 [Thyridium curvatum]TPX13180.1 hypothetical protein E0L32_006380 [Thyridium curvatum]
MENLTISDSPQPGPPRAGGGPQGAPGPMLGGPPPPPQQPQLPAQMFTTAAQLLDLTDKKLMIVLRDGKKMTGILRSWDQFANLVLQSAVERKFVPPELAPDNGAPGGAEKRGLYADFPLGTYIVRGENVLLLGEIDLDKDDEDPVGYDRAEYELVKSILESKAAADKSKEKNKIKKLASIGFEGENMGEILL